MEYILINREGDAKIIADYKTSFETYTLQKLVDAYNKEAQVWYCWSTQAGFIL